MQRIMIMKWDSDDDADAQCQSHPADQFLSMVIILKSDHEWKSKSKVVINEN